MAGPARPGDLRFTGACDGSAAVALDDGRLAVADDEHSSLHVYAAGGGTPEERPLRIFLGFPPPPPDAEDDKDEADIEGSARVGDRIYWIASHGHSRKGKRKSERHLFFATAANAALSPVGAPARTVLTTLIALSGERGADGKPTALAQALAVLHLAALDAAPIAPEAGGINIEALAAGADGSLLIGFCSPKAVGAQGAANWQALVIPLLNPKDVVETGATPRFGLPITLDLGGRGLRDMLRRADGSYAVIAGPIDDGEGFALYRWAGPGGGAPVPLAADLTGLHPEAVVERGGALLLLSDDGDDACKAAAPAARHFAGRSLP